MPKSLPPPNQIAPADPGADSAPFSKVVSLLEDVLSRPPCEAGLRLRSECDVADLLGVHRMKIQRTFNLLVERGILVRRKGSGTFIRKVPPTTSEVDVPYWEGRPVAASDFLAAPAKAPVRKQSSREHRQLNLALITYDWTWDSVSASSILKGVQDRAKQEGHRLKIYSAHFPSSRNPETRRSLLKKLRSNPIDGCLLYTTLGSILTEAFGENPPPAVFIGGATRAIDLSCVPVVRHNLEDSTRRGVALLAEEGYKRIGLIGYADPIRGEEEKEVYRDIMAKLGLDYCSIAHCPLNVEGTTKVLKRMFGGRNQPEAVYVADDVVLRNAMEAFTVLKIIPGKNLGVIALSNKYDPLPADFQWSSLEFNQFQVGRMALDNLLLEIQTAGEHICSFEHIAVWRPGETHRLR